MTWFNENYTRLIVGPRDTNTKDLNQADVFTVSYNPMRVTYESPIQYSRIGLPIIKEEWHVMKEWFAGRSVTLTRQEITWQQIDKEVSLCSFVLPETKFWCVQNWMELNMVTLAGGGKFHERRGVIVDVKNAFEGEVKIIIRVNSENLRPRGDMTVIPKPSKTEYQGTKTILIKFADEPICIQVGCFLGIEGPPLLPNVGPPRIISRAYRYQILDTLSVTQVFFCVKNFFSI